MDLKEKASPVPLEPVALPAMTTGLSVPQILHACIPRVRKVRNSTLSERVTLSFTDLAQCCLTSVIWRESVLTA